MLRTIKNFLVGIVLVLLAMAYEYSQKEVTMPPKMDWKAWAAAILATALILTNLYTAWRVYGPRH